MLLSTAIMRSSLSTLRNKILTQKNRTKMDEMIACAGTALVIMDETVAQSDKAIHDADVLRLSDAKRFSMFKEQCEKLTNNIHAFNSEPLVNTPRGR